VGVYIIELFIGVIIIIAIVWLASKIFDRKSKKGPDKYYVVQERQTQVKNHIVKVPGKKRK